MTAGTVEKPIYVYHEGYWRRYRWTRDLLDITCIGDVITGLDVEEAEDPAVAHLYTRLGAAADIVALSPPTAAIWELLETTLGEGF